MVETQEGAQKLDVLGTRLAMYTSGAGDPAVVLISGLGDSASVWRPVIERLETFTKILSYDRAGSRESDDLLGHQDSTAAPASWAAEQLHELLRRANVGQRVVLVGHSVGGQIADAFTVRWPHMVAGLVLVDAVDAELNLDIHPPRPVLDDAIPARAGRGWKWDVSASADEYATTEPTTRPPAVVVGSAIWRWFQAKQPDLYRPLPLAAVDQRWQLAQLHYARRWQADLVVAHEAGHRVHTEAPGLVATATAAVVEAAVTGGAARLNRDLIRLSGGSVRPTSTPG